MTSYHNIKSMIKSRYLEIKGCGANREGGGGFQTGNTCARGRGGQISTADDLYDKLRKDLPNGTGTFQEGSVTVQITNTWDKPLLLVSAFKEGKEVGSVSIYASGGKVGIPFSISGSSLRVDKDHRRQGVATAMYNVVENVSGMKLTPEPIQTKEGALFTASRKK